MSAVMRSRRSTKDCTSVLKNTNLEITPKEKVWRTKVWTLRRSDAFGNHAVTEKYLLELKHLASGACRCTILLKLTVLLVHLQNGDKLGDDVPIQVSHNSGCKKNRPDDPFVQYGTPYIQFFRVALGHMVHCLGHGFKSGLPIGLFLSEMSILFYRNGYGI